ncbi:MAG: transposase [Thermodesulfobacteriota bacterium]|nr:transposase [Thermodesulfobacteriota bacterium]
MQKHYSLEAKEAIVRRMLPPTSVIITDLCKETGVAKSTLYKWKNDYLNKGISVPSNKSKSINWSAQNKLAIIMESPATEKHWIPSEHKSCEHGYTPCADEAIKVEA